MEQDTDFQVMYEAHKSDPMEKLDAIIASLLHARTSKNNPKLRALTTIVEERVSG